jgi:regulator of replication initiation timing
MDSGSYTQAISAAQQELDGVDQQIAALAQRQAQLQQTISALKNLLGEQSDDEPSMTETIRIILRASKEPLTTAEIVEGLHAINETFGGKNPAASVLTILGRLAAQKEIARVPGEHPARYMWAPFLRQRPNVGQTVMRGHRAKMAEQAEKK